MRSPRPTQEGFAFEFDRRFADVIEQRQSLNDDLFRVFFDRPEFQEAVTTWGRREVYRRIQDELGWRRHMTGDVSQ